MPKEKSVTIPGPPRLEARYAKNSIKMGGIITHPHSLYGGTMDNNVVIALCQAFDKAGLSWLRFNFRGVGRSEGRFEHGVGEAGDIRAAVDYLVNDGHDRVVIAGYSFGGWVSARIGDLEPRPQATILVAPPAAFLPFEAPENVTPPVLVIAGDRDEFCGRAELDGLFEALDGPKRLEVLPGVDHFFWGAEAFLVDLAAVFLSDLAGGVD